MKKAQALMVSMENSIKHKDVTATVHNLFGKIQAEEHS